MPKDVWKLLPSKVDKFMSFAEMIASVSFLRSIPAPVFNSETTIMFNNIYINL